MNSDLKDFKNHIFHMTNNQLIDKLKSLFLF